MREKSFFKKPPKTLGPQPGHIDHRKKNPQNPKYSLDKTVDGLSASIDASSAVKEVLAKLPSLPDAYQKRKVETTSFLKKFIVGTSADRPEEINFITSVTASIDSDTSFSVPLNIRNLATQTKRLNEITRITPLIIDGAYLFVHHEIEESYRKAWVSKDPRASQLYVELTARLGEKSNQDKIACLTALQTHLQSKSVQEKVSFGSKGVDKVLSQLSSQLASLAPTSLSKTM